MKIKYFSDTDTSYVVLNEKPVVDTRDLDENTTIDLDGQGELGSLTIEHARDRQNVFSFFFEQVGAVSPIALS